MPLKKSTIKPKCRRSTMDSSHFQAPFEIHSFFSIFLPKVYHFTGCSTKKLLSKTKWKPEGILFVHTSFNATYRYMLKIAECLSAQLFRLKWFSFVHSVKYTVPHTLQNCFFRQRVHNKVCILSKIRNPKILHYVLNEMKCFCVRFTRFIQCIILIKFYVSDHKYLGIKLLNVFY